MASQQDVIKLFMKSLDETTQDKAEDAINDALDTASGGKFKTFTEVAEAFLADYNASDWQDFLRNDCGIILDNEDTGSITGLDSDGSQLKNDKSIVPESGEVISLDEEYRSKIPTSFDEITQGPFSLDNGKVVVIDGTLSFTKKVGNSALTVHVPEYNEIFAAAEAGDKEAKRKLTIVNGLYTWWIEGAIKLNTDSYGENYGFTSASSTQEMTVNFYYDENDGNAAFTGYNPSRNPPLILKINMYLLSSIASDEVNGKTIENGGYLDNTIAHEFTHAVMAVNIKYYHGILKTDLPMLIREGLAEITRGIDSYRKSKIVDRLGDSKQVNKILSSPYEDDYYSERELKEGQYVIGYALMRYFAKQCADDNPIAVSTGSVTLPSNSEYLITAEGDSTTNVKTANNKFSAQVVGSAVVKQEGIRVHKNPLNVMGTANNFNFSGGDLDDAVSVSGDSNNVNGNDGDDTFSVSGNNNVISGGNGNDSFFVSGNNNNVISGGNGNDSFFVSGNNNNGILGDDGNDSFSISGSGNEINGDDGKDQFIFTAESKNNIIGNFTDGEEIKFESGEIAAKIQTVDETESVVITSAQTGDTLVVLTGVTSGSANYIVWQKDDGGTMSTSIDWLLANTKSDSGKPDDPIKPADEEMDNKIIRGTNGNDEIKNTLDKVQIEALKGDDDITNSGQYNTIDGGAGNDSIFNGGKNKNFYVDGGDSVTIDGGVGNDSIYNSGDSVTINGGGGNDSIGNTGDSVTIDGGVGNDSIYNSGDSVTINGGGGNDSIGNTGDSVTIDGGDGDDSIGNSGDSVTIDGGDGNDNIRVGYYKTSVFGGEGDDTIHNRGDSVTIDGGAGNDSIWNDSGENVTIDSGDGNDSIHNRGDSVTIDSGAGNDNIFNGLYEYSSIYGGKNVSINTGDGDDYIYNIGDSVTIDGGDGNDIIKNGEYGSTVAGVKVLISGGTGNDNIFNGGKNSYVDGGADDDYIENGIYGDLVTIDGSDGDDVIYNSGDSVTIDGGAGNDYIYNYSSNVTINGGTGDDNIYNSGDNVTINGNDGDDYIYNGYESNSSNVSINGGAGDDSIFNDGYGSNSSSNVSINGGTGNDQISLKSYVFGVFVKYSLGDGNDTIRGFNGYDTLSISGGSYSSIKSGNDVILTVGDGKISLIGAASLSTLNIIGTYAPTSTTTGGGSSTSTTGGGSSTTTTGGGASTSTTSGGSSTTTTGGGASTSTTSGGSSTTTTGGGSSTSTTGGGSSTSTTGGGSSTSTTGGGSSTSTTGGGSSTSTTGGGSSTSTTGGGSSTSTSKSGNSSTSTVWDNFFSTSKSSGSSSTSTTRSTSFSGSTATRSGNSSSSTTTGSSSTSTTTGSSSTSTTRGGSLSSTVTASQNIYTGGDKTISNYSGQAVTLGAYAGANFNGNNFFVGSPTGTLVIQNAADKIVDLRDGAGNAFIKAYTPSTAGTIDGRGLAGYEIINGASNGSDVIFAGDGGSSLWGGAGLDADALIGGNGADIFSGGRFQGSDNIFNASSADAVNLTDATLSDIVAAVGGDGSIAIGFNTGNIISIQSTELLSAAINLADGNSFRFNHVTKSWQSA